MVLDDDVAEGVGTGGSVEEILEESISSADGNEERVMNVSINLEDIIFSRCFWECITNRGDGVCASKACDASPSVNETTCLAVINEEWWFEDRRRGAEGEPDTVLTLLLEPDLLRCVLLLLVSGVLSSSSASGLYETNTELDDILRLRRRIPNSMSSAE